MKWVVGGILAASLLFGGTTMAGAVDFRFQGEILFGTGFLSSAFITERNGQRTEAASADKFATLQRFRLQMEAIASETLSSLLCLEVGDNLWGNNESFGGGGAALGTDGQFVKVRHAFMNWTVPDTSPRRIRRAVPPSSTTKWPASSPVTASPTMSASPVPGCAPSTITTAPPMFPT